MRRTTKTARWIAAAVAVSTVIAIGQSGASATITTSPLYAEPVGGAGYDVTALLSVGDEVPRTGHTGDLYKMVGIPDGLGARVVDGDTTAIFVNHELSVWNTGQVGDPADDVEVVSEPIVGGAEVRGAFVSRYLIGEEGQVESGDLAFDEVYQGNRFLGRIATTANDTPAFGRFCSAFMAGRYVGFGRSIYLTNEESDAVFDGRPGTLSPLGGQTVAIFGDQAHALPRLGHFAKENNVIRPGTGKRTVIFSLEDGPTTPDSQLYMYVGKKNRGADNVLNRNGLNNVKLYVFVPDDAAVAGEPQFQGGSLHGHWVAIPNAKNLSEAALEAASDAAGAFGFIRIEDGAFSPESDDDFFFVTTGEGAVGTNRLGRVYHLRLDMNRPTGPARLDLVINADQVVVDGPDPDAVPDEDAPMSPDNVDASSSHLMISEDGTSPSRLQMSALGRDGSIWRLDLEWVGGELTVDPGSRARVVELNPPGRDATTVIGPGIWETSGMIDASTWWGEDAWLFDVQAHRSVPANFGVTNVVEDGQLLLMRPAG